MKLPIAELIIPAAHSKLVEVVPNLAKDARDYTKFSGKPKTTVQVDFLVNRYSDEELATIFGEVEDKVRLSMRSVEYGGFMVRDGKSMVLCGQAGEPLRGQSGKNRVPFKPSLWNRSFDPVFIIRAKSWISDIKGMDQITPEHPSKIIGVYCREIPDEFRYLDFGATDVDIRELLINAASSTQAHELEEYSEQTLGSAIKAALGKASCECCTHVHYGHVTGNDKQPDHNLTPEDDLLRVKSLV